MDILVGRNWRFGKKAKGTPSFLASAGREMGFRVQIVTPVTRRGKPVSSTRIRKEITQGHLGEAADLLGRPVSILGTVMSGHSIGRKLGFPTANLDCGNEVLPPLGVYAVRAFLSRDASRKRRRAPWLPGRGKHAEGVLNLGYRPTFQRDRTSRPTIELHVFDMARRLYGHDIEVFFVKKLRNERRFASRETLRAQIVRDVEKAKHVLHAE
jgi:riboflavin kinase/FMN adenylyltransferase